MPQPPRRLIGKVRNIHPSNPAPTWEVCFDPSEYADDFPAEHETWITVDWPNGSFRTMVGIKPRNRIYLRTKAVPVPSGDDTRVSDLCVTNGLGRAGPITFEVVEPRRHYRVVR